MNEQDPQYLADLRALDAVSDSQAVDSVRQRAAEQYRRRTRGHRLVPYAGLTFAPYELRSATLSSPDGPLEGEGENSANFGAVVGVENLGVRGVFAEATYAWIRFRDMSWHATDSDRPSTYGPRTLDLSGLGVRMGVRFSLPGA